MQVAVAGVEHVGHPDPRRRRDLGDRREHLRQRGARDDAVLDDVVGTDPAHGREGGLAALPDQRALGRVDGQPQFTGAVLPAEPLDLLELALDLDRGAVELDDQHGAGALRIAAVGRCLGGLDGEGVHHLDGRGNDPGADDRRGGRSGLVGGGEAHQQGADVLRQSGQLDRHRRGDAEGALGAHDGAEQVVAGGIGGESAELDDFALRRDELRADHVIGGEAVLQAVRPAGVLGQVAADRAHLLARRVGRIVVAVRCHRPGDLEVGHPRFHGHAPVGDIDVDHPVHA